MMIPPHHSITSASGEFTRDLWLYPALTAESHPLCIFLDAEHYIRDMKSLEVLRELFRSGRVPQMTCVFVSHVSGSARLADYACNSAYAEFIARDLVNWIAERVPVTASGNVLCGLSLSGLQGAYTVSRFPEVFSYALCQSGSFWWLADNPVDFPPSNGRFWMSVGDQETATEVTHTSGLFQRINQIDGVRIAADLLEAQGSSVKFTMYSGGHAPGPWRDDLCPGLEWLLAGLPASAE